MEQPKKLNTQLAIPTWRPASFSYHSTHAYIQVHTNAARLFGPVARPRLLKDKTCIGFVCLVRPLIELLYTEKMSSPPILYSIYASVVAAASHVRCEPISEKYD